MQKIMLKLSIESQHAVGSEKTTSYQLPCRFDRIIFQSAPSAAIDFLVA